MGFSHLFINADDIFQISYHHAKLEVYVPQLVLELYLKMSKFDISVLKVPPSKRPHTTKPTSFGKSREILFKLTLVMENLDRYIF